MDFDEFDHMSLDDLREMLRQVLAAGPSDQDREFVRRLALAIGEREKTFGKGPGEPH